jgi:ferredoxin
MSKYCISIDSGLCSGFGSCVDLAPGLFTLEGGGVAATIAATTDDPAALDAADACPMGAIVVTEAVTA